MVYSLFLYMHALNLAGAVLFCNFLYSFYFNIECKIVRFIFFSKFFSQIIN